MAKSSTRRVTIYINGKEEDASGWQTFSYGKLGEVTENIRTFALPYDAQTYTFKMNFGYDSWNRIMGITYPDGEVVTYVYNLGGMLKSISGTKMNNAYPYIDSIRYNEFELKEAVYYGNGTKTFYKYDILQRLINLQSYTATTATPSELMQNIDYTYDAVSNITDIDNSAGILANGLGGKYHDRHTYDNLYRLVYSKGNWLGSPNTNYELEMSYNLNGRIGRKTLTAGIVTQTPMTNSFNSVGYDNSYHYANTSQPNTLTYIDNNGPQQFFQWDAKGNMTYHKNTAVSLERFLCWDEQNRLQGVRDKSSLSVYQYDANGDRTYKLTGDYTYQNVSGTWRYFYQLDNATLYASPYLVVTPKGYTKHYYAESERIASKLGNGGLQELGHPLADDIQVHDKLFANKNHAQSVIYECLNAEEVRAFSPLSYLYELTSSSQSPEDKRYFYHPDHLGSSSWITFTDGEAVQHLHYLPYGEDLVNQQHTVVGAMYTFSAKEKDAETGYSYFGSRYYNSDLSIWLSVDPQSDKYPSFSPYVYCANNPIKLVDPNGMEAAKPPLHHQFLITVGMQVYKAAKKNGASSNGAILVLAQASLESGWGKSAMRYNDYNLFGVMGTPSKRSTTHGPVKDYSNLGGYEAAINDYFKKAKSRWPKWTAVLSQNDFTSEDIDKALNTGSYYPSKEDRQNGKYAYCGDLDENGESHYGESLIKQFSSTKKRFKDSLIYQINANEKIIQQGIPYSNEYLDRIKEENIQYKSVLDEIK